MSTIDAVLDDLSALFQLQSFLMEWQSGEGGRKDGLNAHRSGL